MATFLKTLSFATAALLTALSFSEAQLNSPAPATSPAAALQSASGSTASAKATDKSPLLVQGAAPAASPAAATTTTEPDANIESGGVGVREFQGDDVGQVLRLLARQAKINMVVSDQIPKDSVVTMRLEDVTALQAISIIVKAKGLFMDKIDNVYYIKTAAERTAEPTESDSYQFSYSRAKDTAPLLASQLASKDPPQIDERTNTIFFRETRSNIDNIRKMLVQIDKPTKQVMIEARLVEVTANPRQSYGINWAGVVGSSTSAKTFNFGGSGLETPGTPGTNKLVDALNVIPGAPGGINPITGLPFSPTAPILTPKLDANGIPVQGINRNALPTRSKPAQAGFNLNNFLLTSAGAGLGQFAILSVPQMSATLRFLNEDADAEFLANPRVVTADNQQARIEITRNQPVPQLNFNEQTATAVFGGFQDKIFGNKLLVRPSVNKDNFITLSVKPEISNKVGDQPFIFAGATVTSPIIDTRTLDSNVLIKSGDTLAIGGLLQDEQTKARTKVPLLGDVPILGYFFQEKLNARTKRNLLVFVTPTIIDGRYGTGLEDQVSGLHHTGEEYSDPNGWRNNAKGAVRLVPTSNRQLAADYAKPGIPPPPEEANEVQFKSSAKDRDF